MRLFSPVQPADAATIEYPDGAPAFTPGPWEACSNLVRTARTREGGGFLVATCPANIGCRIEDARLIAAAPAMFKALGLIAEACRATDYRDPLPHARIADIATAALSKAIA